MKPHQLLYLQLPLLDNDASGTRENFPFAGAYLEHALRRSTEAPFHVSRFAPTAWDELDTPHLAAQIVASGAEIVACTLYLWNIERTIDLAQRLKHARPEIRIAAGGPEVAHNHPLLERAPFDAVVSGEGEGVFPAILNAWRTGTAADFSNVALRSPSGLHWGRHPPPAVNLAEAQPDEAALMACMQNRPVVYLETVRGCPLSCSYCRYFQLHTGLRALTPGEVVARIRRFRELGAAEIRFVDPTFNARKNFTSLLAALAELNHDRTLAFFAEIRADTLTEEQARLMALAHFTEVEIGVQSIDPRVLENVRRPNRIDRLGRGIRLLCEAGVRVVLDAMYGLPGQSRADVEQSLAWCLDFGENAQVQCMQTLLLPGTRLRADADRWQLESDALPPYGIRQTPDLSDTEIRAIESFLAEHPRLPADPATPRFCAERLAGLFRAQHRIATDALDGPVPGRANRRALIIAGTDLFQKRQAIAGMIARAIASDPFALWQFVLEPEQEEPLDLLDFLTETIRRQPAHLLDRFASAAAFGKIVSRRLYVRVRHPRAIGQDWRAAADVLLRESFG